MLKNAPNAVIIICATVLCLGVLGAYVFLANQGKDAAEISRFVNTLLNFAMILVGSVGAVAAGAAAKSSAEAKQVAEKAVEQTNGSLDTRIQSAISSALSQQRTTDDERDAERENPNQGKLL